MAYTVQNYRDLTRTTLDLDENDLPNTLVDAWIRDGAVRCQTARRMWPFFNTSWTYTVPAGTSQVTFDTIEAGDDQPQIAEIERITTATRVLRRQPLERYDSRNHSSIKTGSPMWYSVWGNQFVVFDPQPTADTDITVRGYQKHTDWVADGAAGVSDMPAEFDDCILNWTIGRAYAQQDEPQSALYYADMADVRLRELVRWYDDMPIDEIIVGGGWSAELADPRIPWE